MKAELDLKYFDGKELTEKEWNKYISKLSVLTMLAEMCLDKKIISKITYNRIERLWLFLPRMKGDYGFLSTEKFNNLFKIKNLDLIKIENALNKLYRGCNKLNQNSQSE